MIRHIFKSNNIDDVFKIAEEQNIDKELIFKENNEYVVYFDTNKRMGNSKYLQKTISDCHMLYDNPIKFSIENYYVFVRTNAYLLNSKEISNIVCSNCKKLEFDNSKAIIDKDYICKKNPQPFLWINNGALYLEKRMLDLLELNSIVLESPVVPIKKFDNYFLYNYPITCDEFNPMTTEVRKGFDCGSCGLHSTLCGSNDVIYYDSLEDKPLIFGSKELSDGYIVYLEARLTRPYIMIHPRIAYIMEYLITFVQKEYQDLVWIEARPIP